MYLYDTFAQIYQQKELTVMSLLTFIQQLISLARMWCDPSLSLDLDFLSLIPSLDFITMTDYPVDGKKLRHLMNQAVGKFSLNAVIGGTTLLFIKNEVNHLKIDFPIVHLGFLDKIFYLVGESLMSNKTQVSILKLTSLAVRKWFEQTSKEELQKILHSLKSELNIFQKSMQCVQDKGEKKLLIIKMLLMFDNLLRSQKTKDQPFGKKFEDHANYIHINKRSLFLLNILYQIQYLLTFYIHKHTNLHSPQHLLAFIQLKLCNTTYMRRLSVIFQNTTFILRKLLVLKNSYPISSEIQTTFLLRLQEILEKIFTKAKLIQYTDYFPYHMKESNFISYLTQLFNPKIKRQFELIHQWKSNLAAYMVESLPTQFREVNSSHIHDAIFFVQLREKHLFLRSQNKAIDINQFPFITERIILRAISHNQLKFNGINLSLKIMQILEKEQGRSYYQSLNILEKGIMFYYINYCQGYSFFQNKQPSLKKDINYAMLNTFKNNLTNEDIIELIQFYLLDIQLGNYHAIQISEQFVSQNSVNILVYQSLINLLYSRLTNSLSQYKKLETTKDLYYLKTMHKYFIILIYAINPEYKQVPFICRCCKKMGNGIICNECQYLCSGIKLNRPKNSFKIYRDKKIYQEMIYKVRQKGKQVHRQIQVEMQLHTVQWLYMLLAVIESIIPF